MTQPTANTSPMTIGLDVGDKTTHFCVLASKEVVKRGSFRTTQAELDAGLAEYQGARLVLEAGSQSPWMSRHLRDKGFHVHIADPRRVQLISKDPRKTDRRDAELLARLEDGVPSLLGQIHHRGEQAQAHLALIRSRDKLVRARTGFVQHVRGTAKMFGKSLPSTSPTSFSKRVRDQLPKLLLPAVDPMLDQIDGLSSSIRDLDKKIAAIAEEHYPEITLLQQIQGVGPVTATAFVLTIEDPSRFEDSRRVGSWLGLCPRSHASGDRDPELPISKCGDTFLRRLLVQCAHYILGPFGKDCDLRRFGQRLIARGGRVAKKRAAVAVARKLAVLLHRLWKHGLAYDPLHEANRQAAVVA